MKTQIITLLLAQLFLGLVNCQYGAPSVQRQFVPVRQQKPQQSFGYGSMQQPLRDIPTTTTTTTTTKQVPILNFGYGQQQPLDTSYGQEQDLSLDVSQPTDPCEPNPCVNMGTCVSSEDFSGFWCYCLDGTYGDFCENVVTTTTTMTTTTRRVQKLMPIRKPVQYQQVRPTTAEPLRLPVQQGYGQQQLFDLPTTTLAPLPVVPQYNRQPIRLTTPAPLPVVQPSYGQRQTQLDVVVTSGCLANPCLNEGTCNDLPNGNFFCTCPWGFVGSRCEECITDCKSNPCPSNKLCKAKYGGGFDCVCPADRTGFNCEIQNDICSSTSCLNGGECKALPNGEFSCLCAEGFAGVNCETIWSNPCTEEVLRSPTIQQFEYPWDRAAYIICVDIDTWVPMPCSNGTFFSKRLGQCVGDDYVEPACPQGFCLNDGECGLDARGQLACACKGGFSGLRCEIDIDECALNRNACSGGMCVDQINTYYCVCPNDRVGLDCSNTIEQPCTSDSVDPEDSYFEILSANNDHYLHCTNIGQWVVRKCADGLFWNQEEKTCTINRPLLKTGACLTFPCKNGGHCQDVGYNQYRCECREGYTGPHCETMIDFCLSNPCKNGGRCLPYAGGYTCVCPDKVIDECCCNGVLNPCSDRSSVYYPHLIPNRYIHCDADLRAFVRTCPPTTRWVQSSLACLSEEIILGNATTPEPQIILRDPVPSFQPSYGQMPDLPIVPVVPVTPKPILRDPVPSYGQVPKLKVQPVQPSYGQMPSLPVQQPILRDPVPSVQPSYGQMPTLPVVEEPILRDQVQSSYGQVQRLPVRQPVQSSGRIQLPRVSVPLESLAVRRQ